MFDPRHHLQLAEELRQCPCDDRLFEAKQRAAVSRAYYCVFLRARAAAGCRPDAKHHEVRDAVRPKGGNKGKSLADRLKIFYEDRCNADYGDLVTSPDWAAESAIGEAEALNDLIKEIYPQVAGDAS